MTFRRGRPRHDPGPRRRGSTTPATSATSCGSRRSTSGRCSTAIVAAGEPHGLRLFGMRALMSLRLEKSYGTWFREYRPIYTPLEGGHHPLHQARPRVHRPGGARGGGRARRPEAPARRVRRRARPGRPGRRHRRRADLARRRGRRLGDVRRLRPPRQGVDRARLRPDGAGRRRTDRAARASRSRSSAGADRRGSSPSRCSTPRASGCASDRADRGRGSGRIVVDGRPIAFEAGDSVAIAIVRGGRAAGTRRDAVPGRRLRQLPRRRSTASRTSGRARPPARPGRRSSSGTRPTGNPPLPAARPDADAGRTVAVARREAEVAVIGGGSSGAALAGSRAAGGPSLVLDAGDGDEVVGDLRRADDRRPDAGAGCSTSRPTRSSSRPARPRSSRSARATTWPGSSPRARPSGSRGAPASSLAGAGRDASAGDARPVRGRRRRAGSAPS